MYFLYYIVERSSMGTKTRPPIEDDRVTTMLARSCIVCWWNSPFTVTNQEVFTQDQDGSLPSSGKPVAQDWPRRTRKSDCSLKFLELALSLFMPSFFFCLKILVYCAQSIQDQGGSSALNNFRCVRCCYHISKIIKGVKVARERHLFFLACFLTLLL